MRPGGAVAGSLAQILPEAATSISKLIARLHRIFTAFEHILLRVPSNLFQSIETTTSQP
jgi:hypothetical protein